jgi:hypothetical protein
LNRVVWDLRSGVPAGLTDQRGPFVLPGTYTVTVRVAGRESTATLRVDPDPAFPVSDAERRSRFEFLTEALRIQAGLARITDAIRGVREQLTALEDQLKRQPSAPASVVDGAARLTKTLADLEGRIAGGGGGGGGGGLRRRASGLFSELDGSGIHQGTLSGPTTGQRRLLDTARTEAQTLQGEVDRALGADLTALNDEIARLKIPRLVRP